MTAFQSAILNILDPCRLGYGEEFLNLIENTCDDRLGFEGSEFLCELIRLAPVLQHAPFHRGDVVLGQALPADHPKFLSFMVSFLAGQAGEVAQ